MSRPRGTSSGRTVVVRVPLSTVTTEAKPMKFPKGSEAQIAAAADCVSWELNRDGIVKARSSA